MSVSFLYSCSGSCAVAIGAAAFAAQRSGGLWVVSVQSVLRLTPPARSFIYQECGPAGNAASRSLIALVSCHCLSIAHHPVPCRSPRTPTLRLKKMMMRGLRGGDWVRVADDRKWESSRLNASSTFLSTCLLPAVGCPSNTKALRCAERARNTDWPMKGCCGAYMNCSLAGFFPP